MTEGSLDTHHSLITAMPPGAVHPRFRQRLFVLDPLAELAPDLRAPVTGLAVADLLGALLRDEAR